MLISLRTLLAILSSMVRSRAALELENLALRHQIGVLQRSVRKRPKLTSGDRLFWVCLSRLWRNWRSVLAIVKPETVVAWHRAGFRLFWTWKVRRGHPGRPVISREFRELIRQMCRENPGWGAPRIHGELLKLGIDIGESSVSKYMVTVAWFCAGAGKTGIVRAPPVAGFDSCCNQAFSLRTIVSEMAIFQQVTAGRGLLLSYPYGKGHLVIFISARNLPASNCGEVDPRH